jgi:hypothetical protein
MGELGKSIKDLTVGNKKKHLTFILKFKNHEKSTLCNSWFIGSYLDNYV